jgi:predicted dehydrogenase
MPALVDTPAPAPAPDVAAAMPAAGSRKLRAAVIGTGVISEQHLKYLSADPLVDLVGVCDLSPSLAKYAVAKFGAREAYTDAAAMIRQAKPDVVHVLTPPHTHVPIVTDALTQGAHVVCEKPIAPQRQQFLDLWTLARAKGLRLIEDHNYRFNEPVLAIEKLVAEGKLGTVHEVEVRMALQIRKAGGRYADATMPHPSHNLPAGVLHEFISHLCYLTLRFMPVQAADVAAAEAGGELFPRVAAAWSNHGVTGPFKFDDLDALVISGPAHGRIRFSCSTAPDTFTVVVRGDKGWVETDLFQPFLRVTIPRKGGTLLSSLVNHWVNGKAMKRAAVRGFRNKIMQHTPYEGLGTFLGRTYDALRAGAEPPVTFADMDRASRLIDALLDEKNQV